MRGRSYCSGSVGRTTVTANLTVTVGRSYPVEHLSIGTLSRVAQQLTAALTLAASSSCVVCFFDRFVCLFVMLPDIQQRYCLSNVCMDRVYI